MDLSGIVLIEIAEIMSGEKESTIAKIKHYLGHEN